MSTLPEKLVEVGDTVEEITITDADGKQVSLHEVSGDGGVLIGFMHGTYCPHCIQQLNRSNLLAGRLKEHQVTLAWVLRDKSSSIGAYKLAASPPPIFHMLADSEPSSSIHFGVLEEELEFQPAPLLILMDKQGTIHYVKQRENPHAPLQIDQVLKAIESRKSAHN